MTSRRRILLFVVLCQLALLASATGLESSSEALDEESNGYEDEGIDGHHGLFRAFDWTKDELRSISLWHATAQYQNVIELVKVESSEDCSRYSASYCCRKS